MNKLIGSTTSPYVRRIRLMLKEQDYKFVCVSTFEPEGQKIIAQYSSTRRIPLWVEDELVIWDSLLITEHLSESPLSLETKKELVLINEMTDSGMQLFQLRKFQTDPQDQGRFSQNNLKRIGQILDHFEQHDLSGWNVRSQWLYCTLDWFDFRKVVDWKSEHPNLATFHQNHCLKDDVQNTDPRV